MTFYVNGIKQQKEQKYPIEMIVDAEQEATVRKFLEANQILILSIKLYTEDEKSFGDVVVQVRYDNQSFRIVSKYTDIQEACAFFLFIGMDVVQINSLHTPISEGQSIEIITQARQETEKKQQELEEAQELKDEEKRKIYSDAHLEDAKRVVLRVFEKIDQAITRAEGVIDIQDMKELNRLSAELKKLRLGTNVEKIVEVIQSIFMIIEKVDDAYFASQEAQSQYILSDSVVRLTDVDRELERMENVKILKSIGAHISIKNKDYSTFGASAIFWKFLQKDLLNKLTAVPKMLSGLYDVAEFILLIVLALLGVYTLLNQVYLFSSNQFGLAYTLMNVGLRGMVIFAARYFRKRNIGRLLLIIAIAILLHYLLLWAVTTNFAL